jgi:hypothetical protein
VICFCIDERLEATLSPDCLCLVAGEKNPEEAGEATAGRLASCPGPHYTQKTEKENRSRGFAPGVPGGKISLVSRGIPL